MESQDPSDGQDYLAREAKARVQIDKQLAAAGWVVQSQQGLNLGAGPGVAVREFSLEKPYGRVDYLLFLSGQPAGVIEAKPEGTTLTEVERQSGKYVDGLPGWMKPPVPAPGRARCPVPSGEVVPWQGRRHDGRSSRERRQQLKWLLAGAAASLATGLIGIFTGVFGSHAPATVQAIASFLNSSGFVVLAVCVGVAILKYRLYDIDRIISRTLAYAIVTGLLIGVYVGLVTLTTGVLPFTSTVGVAISTLAAAAMFSPARRRVQHAVDRRFNRARYDADQTVAVFAARLKDAVDLDSVRNDLADAIDQALEPAHVSVWISPQR